MSAAKKQRPNPIFSPSNNKTPVKQAPDKQVSLREVKMQAERLRETLQKSIIDNPQAARKAALVIGLWIEGKEKKRLKP